MADILLANEANVRLGFFCAVFGVMAIWELLSPRRRQEIPRLFRWSNNLALVVMDTIIIRFTFPILAVSAAVLVEDRSFGFFHLVNIPSVVVFILSMLLLDLIIYFQHRIFHNIPWFWRLHRMHHADLEFDVTTGIRFHPLEIVISMAIKLSAIAILGLPALAVLLFEIVLNATSLFNHSNLRLPAPVDRALRLFLVTPDMHRVHHSIRVRETNSNFGFNFPWWDKIFGTYQDQPVDGHEKMIIGLTLFREAECLRIDKMLLQPFKSKQSQPDKRT